MFIFTISINKLLNIRVAFSLSRDDITLMWRHNNVVARFLKWKSHYCITSTYKSMSSGDHCLDHCSGILSSFQFQLIRRSGAGKVNGRWNLPETNIHSDVIMGTMSSQITSLTTVYSTVYSGVDQRKHQCSASLAFVREIHRWPVKSPHKWPVKRKMFPFDDVIMRWVAVTWLYNWYPGPFTNID